MRACLFTPNFLPATGGAERMADTIVRELIDRGHSLFVLAQHTADRDADHAYDAALPYPVRRYRRPPAQHLWPRVIGRALRKSHATWGFDIVLCFYAYPTGYAATRVANQLGVKVVVSPRGGDLYPNFHGLKKPGVQRAIAAGYRDADRIVSISDWLTQRILEATGLPRDRLPPIDQTANGLDLGVFDSALQSAERGTLPLKPDERFLLHLGRVAPVKRVPLAIEAVAQAADVFREQRVRYAVVGDGADRETVRELVGRRNLSDVVSVLGPRDGPEKFWLLKHALGFVTSSREEGMPNAVLEAMAAGLPTLASDIGPHRELLRNQGWGQLCGATDPAGWAEAMQQFLRADHTAMRNAALGLRERYTLDRTIDGYEQSLRHALDIT